MRIPGTANAIIVDELPPGYLAKSALNHTLPAAELPPTAAQTRAVTEKATFRSG